MLHILEKNNTSFEIDIHNGRKTKPKNPAHWNSNYTWEKVQERQSLSHYAYSTMIY